MVKFRKAFTAAAWFVKFYRCVCKAQVDWHAA